MNITIAKKHLFFSHAPGIHVLLPKTFWQVQCFPTLLRLTDIEKFGKEKNVSISLSLKGPIENYLVTQDLEKGKIVISGKAKKDFFRYQLSSKPSGLEIYLIKGPKEGIDLFLEDKKIFLKVKEPIVLPFAHSSFSLPTFFETLSLGVHKKNSWDRIRERKDEKEIFPLWLRLSQFIPLCQKDHKKGAAKILLECTNGVEKKECVKMMMNLWQVGFGSGMVPRLVDEEFLGILPHFQKEELYGLSPFVILHEGAKIILSWVFQKEKNKLIFPAPPFPCGRLVHLKCGDLGSLDIEWKKKIIRRVIFRCKKTEKISLHLPKEINSFRMRESKKDRGKIINSFTSLTVEKEKVYEWDRFQKR